MKTSVFKQLIKEAVKEVFQEEMKSILLEAVRAPKTIVNESLRETYTQPSRNTYAQPKVDNPKTLSPEKLPKKTCQELTFIDLLAKLLLLLNSSILESGSI